MPGEFNPRQSKGLVLVVGTLLVSTVVGLGIYLPFYSQMSLTGLEKRQEIQRNKEAKSQVGPQRSMWDNINANKSTRID